MVKLLQATSPEAAEQPGARAGEFWLTGQNINLGPEITGTPILLRKSYVIWNPHQGSRQQRPARDRWRRHSLGHPELKEFTVFFPNNQTPYHVAHASARWRKSGRRCLSSKSAGQPAFQAGGVVDLSDAVGVQTA